MTSLGDLAKGIFQKISIFAINAFFGGFCDRNLKKRLDVPENRIFFEKLLKIPILSAGES